MIGNVPDTAYFQNAGTAKTIHKVAVSQENIFYAKFLSAYGTEANMKALFYLDFLCERVKIKNADGTTEIGYMGGVYDDPNGFNYKHHNPNKLSRKGLAVKDSGGAVKYIIVLNDPLNTRGDIPAFTLSSALETGGFKFNATYKSAYYIPCDLYIRFRKNQESTWKTTTKFRTIPQNTTFLEEDRFWNLDDHYTLSVGQIYDVELYISNPEGEIYTGVKTVTILPYVVKMRRGSSPANAYNSSTIIDVYPSTRNIDVGTILYENYSNQLPYNAGHYMHQDSGIYYVIDDNGVVTSKGFYSPTTNIGYTGSVTRLSTGAKFGDYVAEFTITNGSNASEIAPICVVEVGKLNGSGVMTEVIATHTFPGVTVPAQSTSERSESGFIEEVYADFTWGYRAYKNGVLIGSGNL